MVGAVEATFQGMPDRFWIVISHASNNEKDNVMNALLDTYEIIQNETRLHAYGFLLQAKK